MRGRRVLYQLFHFQIKNYFVPVKGTMSALPCRATALSAGSWPWATRLRDLFDLEMELGLPLVSVTQVEPDQPNVPTTEPR